MENMFYISILVLTLFSICYILYKGRNYKVLKNIVYSQSTIHEIIKPYIPSNFLEKPKKLSQAEMHAEKNTIKVIFVEDKAYWVSNNIFYAAEAINGNVDTDTAEPVNTQDITKTEVDKLLFILDNLKNGSKNDSGGSGNQRL